MPQPTHFPFGLLYADRQNTNPHILDFPTMFPAFLSEVEQERLYLRVFPWAYPCYFLRPRMKVEVGDIGHDLRWDHF